MGCAEDEKATVVKPTCADSFRNVLENNHFPARGRYKNSLVEDEMNGLFYMYDACGAYVALSVSGGGGGGPGVAPVLSVNGKQGVVVLNPDDLDDTSTAHKFMSTAQIAKLAGIEVGAQVNTVTSVNGQVGEVVIATAILSAKDFGAVGDGINDDTVNLQNAMDAAVAQGKVLFIPAGTYLISASLEITDPVSIFGYGWDTKIKIADGTDIWAFTFDGVTDNRSILRDFVIDGNCAEQTAGGGIDGPGAVEGIFDHIYFQNCHDYGLRLAGFASLAFGHSNRVINCLFDLTADSAGIGGGILLTSSDENYISHNTFAFMGGATTPRMISDEAGNNMILFNSFVGSRSGTTNCRGVQLESGNNSTVVANVFDALGGDNVFVKGTNHTIMGNRFNIIGDQGTVPCSGVYLEFGAQINTVMGNIFTADAGGGTRSYIREDGGGDPGNNMIIGNVFPDSPDLTVGKVELFTASAAGPTRLLGNVGVLDNLVDVDADVIRIRQDKTPATAGAAGLEGQIAWDANYIYVCTATNTWKRAAIATW